MAYILFNEELGYFDYCPTFETKEDAKAAAGKKCRFHSVRETSEIKPCNPVALRSACLRCAACSAPVAKVHDFIQSQNNDSNR